MLGQASPELACTLEPIRTAWSPEQPIGLMTQDEMIDQDIRHYGLALVCLLSQERQEELLLGGEVLCAFALPIRPKALQRAAEGCLRCAPQALRNHEGLVVVARKANESRIAQHQSSVPPVTSADARARGPGQALQRREIPL